ncbi:RRQRL motif-containing zinc-binding protein [Embleya sp. NPDC050493]|uniref:RRQRL motif-containing zinc-binding protein n=1 Tax=Embleya sp. NPDC050493 TaxID=3363989 RepID=UPI003796945D
MTRVRARYQDPEGRRHGGMPTYAWRMAPEGLATRRQLRARGLRPAGQQPVGQVMWGSRRRGRPPRVAYLYRVDLARRVRPMTAGRWRSVAAAMRARRTCPTCRIDAGYVIPTSLGACVPCATGPDTHPPDDYTQ